MISGGAGLVFKGSGFYVTDYKRAGEKPGTKEADSKPAEGKTGESKAPESKTSESSKKKPASDK